MRYKRFVVSVLVLVLLAACTSIPAMPTLTAEPTQEPLSGRITFAGSTTVQPLAHLLGQAFQERHPKVMLDIAAGGSSVGIQAIHDGTVDIGMASRQLKPEEAEGIEQYQIAVDVIAVVVHVSNPVEGLALEQLHDVYLGRIRNWREVGGDDREIVAVVRDINSGTRAAFDEIVLEGLDPAADPLVRAITAGDMAALVAQTPGAIGYVGFGNLEPDLALLSIDGVIPSEQTAQDGSYTLTRPLLLLTGPLTQPLAYEFIEMALSDEGQVLVAESGWVPAQ